MPFLLQYRLVNIWLVHHCSLTLFLQSLICFPTHHKEFEFIDTITATPDQSSYFLVFKAEKNASG